MKCAICSVDFAPWRPGQYLCGSAACEHLARLRRSGAVGMSAMRKQERRRIAWDRRAAEDAFLWLGIFGLAGSAVVAGLLAAAMIGGWML